MAGRTKAPSETPRPGKTKKLGKTVIALAATALVEKAIQKGLDRGFLPFALIFERDNNIFCGDWAHSP